MINFNLNWGKNGNSNHIENNRKPYMSYYSVIFWKTADFCFKMELNGVWWTINVESMSKRDKLPKLIIKKKILKPQHTITGNE